MKLSFLPIFFLNYFSLQRAPEIALGLHFTEAIDVWGVGCTLAFLYLADNLFPVDCDFQMVPRSAHLK